MSDNFKKNFLVICLKMKNNLDYVISVGGNSSRYFLFKKLDNII